MRARPCSSDLQTIQIWDAQTESCSTQAGKSPTMQIQPYPFPPIYYMPDPMLSTLPNAGDRLINHSQPLGHGLFLTPNGWIVGSNDQLFLWVPPSYHPFHWYSPSNNLIIRKVPVLDFSNIAHGPAWDQCVIACTNNK